MLYNYNEPEFAVNNAFIHPNLQEQELNLSDFNAKVSVRVV